MERKSKKSNSSVTFYCFTPAVSLATFIIETIFAVYILLRYKATHFSLLSTFILFLLALFQFSEYMVCTTPNPAYWGKIGLAVVTLLPVAGIHMVSMVSKRHLWTVGGYVLAATLVGIILFWPEVAITAVCNSSYVDIQTIPFFSKLYGLYYAGFLLLGIVLLALSLYQKIGDKKEEEWLLVGYLAFYVPALILFYFKIVRHTALPSIMCGFALLLAVIFVTILLPRYYYLVGKRKK